MSRRRKHLLSFAMVLVGIVVVASIGGVSSRTGEPADEIRVMVADDVASPTKQAGDGNGRIVNGSKAPSLTSTSPWRSSVFLWVIHENGEQSSCTGTFVAKRYVLTAAHCLANLSGRKDAVLVYGTNGTLDAKPLVDALVSARTLADLAAIPSKVPNTWMSNSMTIHSGYAPRSGYRNDIALVKTDRDARYAPTLIPGVNERGSWGGGTGYLKGAIAGWGLTNPYDHSSSSRYLMQADVPIRSDRTCTAATAAIGGTYDTTNLCAGILQKGTTTGVTACMGDSGGPLVGFAADGSTRLVGVTSYGPSTCLHGEAYGVFTRTDSFRSWIEATTGRVSGSTNTPVVDTGDGTPGPLTITAPGEGAAMPETGTTQITWTGGDPDEDVQIIQRSNGTDWGWWRASAGATSFAFPNSELYRRAPGQSQLCVQQNWDEAAASCRSISMATTTEGGGGGGTTGTPRTFTSPADGLAVGARGATTLTWSGGDPGTSTKITVSAPGPKAVRYADGNSFLLGHGLLVAGGNTICIGSSASTTNEDCLTFVRSGSTASAPRGIAQVHSGLLRRGKLTFTGRVASTVRSVRVRVQMRDRGRWVTIGTTRVRIPSYASSTRFKVATRWNRRLARTITVRTTVWYGSRSRTTTQRMR